MPSSPLLPCSADPTCPKLGPGGPCPEHAPTPARARTAQRGYGGRHQRARAELAKLLPTPCGYGCGTVLTPDGPWVAAHRVDGDPEAGWLAACPSCNERAKLRP